jgi:predicted dehydrogenase
VASDDIDAVVIGTWPYMHCPVTLEALSRGKHVLCEARMAMDADEARLMHETARHNPDCVAQIVPSPLTLAVDALVIDAVANGRLGTITGVEIVSTNGNLLDPAAPLTWRLDRKLSGNNTLTLGIWYEALQRWMGDAAEVQASARTFTHLRPDPETGLPRAVEIPDQVAVTARMAAGCQARMLFSGMRRGPAQNYAEIHGTAGGLKTDGSRLWVASESGEWKEESIPDDKRGAWSVERDFISSIRDGAPVTRTNFDDGLRYMAFTDAVLESARTGAAVPVLV